MENKSHAFMAGLFTIVLASVIVATLYWFNRDATVRIPYDLMAHSSVTGLNPESIVRYRGLAVGKVKSIAFDSANPGQIRIRILVDQDTPITKSTFATLSYQGVTGLAFVQLDDEGDDKTRLLSSDKQVAQLQLQPSFVDDLKNRGNRLVHQLESASAAMNQLLSEDNRRELMAAVGNVKDAASSVSAIAKQLQPVTANLPPLMAELQGTLAGTHKLTAQLSDPSGPLVHNLNSIGRAAERADTSLAAFEQTLRTLQGALQQDALPRFNTLSDELRSTSRAVGAAADTIHRNPRALLFGTTPPAPGPGESGFVWPGAGATN